MDTPPFSRSCRLGRRMRGVGVAGGIGTGKNKFSNTFTAIGFPDADVHLFPLVSLKKCIGAWKKVGSDSSLEKVLANGEADRLKQGQISFDEPPKAIYQHEMRFASPRIITAVKFPNPWWVFKNFSHSSVSFVISQGKPKFEIQELDPGPPKKKWKTTKKLKLHRKKEKQKRKAANKRDPKHLGIKARRKFANVEDRIKYKLENAKIKEALLIERLKRYEVDKLQGPLKKPVGMTGEERFYLKKMAQKSSNYAPVGKRGIFGGVILNMHMHWKKHETVKVICKPCKPGQIQEYANEIARLSGGIPIQVIGNDTIIFYRGKDYVQPEVMSPIDTLSKKRALEKSKYEQSLETVRHFIAIAEKELELYHKHIALYGEPTSSKDPDMIDNSKEVTGKPTEVADTDVRFFAGLSDMDSDLESEENVLLLSELENEDDCEARNKCGSGKEGREDSSFSLHELENSIKNCMFYR